MSLFCHRVIIPRRFREQILNELHDGHPGAERMKLLSRSKLYWPRIDTDIETTVRSCVDCATYSRAPTKTSLHYFLNIVDALSNWPEIFKMTSTTTAKTIERLEKHSPAMDCPTQSSPTMACNSCQQSSKGSAAVEASKT